MGMAVSQQWIPHGRHGAVQTFNTRLQLQFPEHLAMSPSIYFIQLRQVSYKILYSIERNVSAWNNSFCEQCWGYSTFREPWSDYFKLKTVDVYLQLLKTKYDVYIQLLHATQHIKRICYKTFSENTISSEDSGITLNSWRDCVILSCRIEHVISLYF